ncbi:hypothetical protein [Malacoplasma iowae]|uniref:Uncharacterized protein n=1 Tax=Malacoplasma iowae DK-CPA TaxID=1394179 RepID=A0A084U4R2_MALIO|nr:hypothetical protein [Malacoplasma iowae]KFB07948.1 hypothetical protein P271_813 [Malacoplasma iowae DK-CPA]WPL36732.1 hypothetical protein QX179_04900 [Malacoplasma iowae]WPL37949.1 hypothetical protein QX182_00260 [Malacoplasma iowae]WPL41346.1 hypothetical protein QX184_01955 [Malacoplasma iowae]
MSKFSRKKKMLIGSLTVLASFGVVGGVALSLDSTLTKYNTSTNSGSSINVNNSIDLPQAPVSSGNSTTVGGENSNGAVDSSAMRMTLTRTVSLLSADAYAYQIKLINNQQKEGTIYFVTPSGLRTDTINFQPGDEIKLLFDPNKGYEGYTVREFKITGASESHFVPTKNDKENKRQFIAKMPEYKDTIDELTNKSWLYSDDSTPITINPSFIIADIGQNGETVEWEHGAFMEVVNGYVYNLNADTKLSEILTKYEAFKNDNITNPINLFFYLNGHKLILDTNLLSKDADKYAPSGWNLAFYNNSSDSATKEGKYGSIVLDESYNNSWTSANVGRFEFKGVMSFGRSVNYRYVTMSNGIQFLNNDGKDSIVGDIVNVAGKQ